MTKQKKQVINLQLSEQALNYFRLEAAKEGKLRKPFIENLLEAIASNNKS